MSSIHGTGRANPLRVFESQAEISRTSSQAEISHSAHSALVLSCSGNQNLEIYRNLKMSAVLRQESETMYSAPTPESPWAVTDELHQSSSVS